MLGRVGDSKDIVVFNPLGFYGTLPPSKIGSLTKKRTRDATASRIGLQSETMAYFCVSTIVNGSSVTGAATARLRRGRGAISQITVSACRD